MRRGYDFVGQCAPAGFDLVSMDGIYFERAETRDKGPFRESSPSSLGKESEVYLFL